MTEGMQRDSYEQNLNYRSHRYEALARVRISSSWLMSVTNIHIKILTTVSAGKTEKNSPRLTFKITEPFGGVTCRVYSSALLKKG